MIKVADQKIDKSVNKVSRTSRNTSNLTRRRSVVEQNSSLHSLGKVTKKFKARKDQVKAIDKVVQGLKENDRGQLLLPCGTGKTLTSLWIKEELKPKRTLVVVPSLALVKQTKESWEEQRKNDFNYLCVCSDQDVDKTDNINVDLKDLNGEGKVTTNPKDIKRFLRSTGPQVVYSTYQSLPKIIEAMRGSKFKFDIAFLDEAHKTTGLFGKLFTHIHSDDLVPCRKRLYMTATPKIAMSDVSDIDSEMIAEMSNEEIYGPVLHRMSFAEAIEAKILSEYKIIAVGVEEEEVKKYIEEFSVSNPPEIINNIALEKVMRKYKANHALTFHSRVKSAQEFQENHQKIYPKTASFHVNGKQSINDRQSTMKRFANCKAPTRAVISNAKCLTEGVDIPAIDLVYFADPKSSTVDIVQGAGRAFRKDRKNPNKVGYIVVPILHNKKRSLDKAIEGSSYKHLVNTIAALANHDERLVADLCVSSSDWGKYDPGDDCKKDQKLELIGIDQKKLGQHVFDQVIKKSQTRLRSQLYSNFEEAKEAVLKVQATRPSALAKFFDKEMIKVVGIGLQSLKILHGDLDLSLISLADAIWGSKYDLNAIKDKILDKYPQKPENVYKLLYQNLEKEFGIGVKALASLMGIKGGSLSTKIANEIWGKNDFLTHKEKVLKVQKKRPAVLSTFFKGLTKKVGFGLETLRSATGDKNITQQEIARMIWGARTFKDFNDFKKFILQHYPKQPNDLKRFFQVKLDQAHGVDYQDEVTRLVGKKPNLKKLAEQIWEPALKPQSFKVAKQLILEDQETRPSNPSKYFMSEIGPSLGFGYIHLQDLYGDRSVSLIELADKIWGKESFVSLKRKIKAQYPERPKSMDKFFRNIFKNEFGMTFVTLKSIYGDKTLSLIELGNKIWGKPRKLTPRGVLRFVRSQIKERPKDTKKFEQEVMDKLGYGAKKLRTLLQIPDASLLELMDKIWRL